MITCASACCPVLPRYTSNCFLRSLAILPVSNLPIALPLPNLEAILFPIPDRAPIGFSSNCCSTIKSVIFILYFLQDNSLIYYKSELTLTRVYRFAQTHFVSFFNTDVLIVCEAF